MNQWVAIGMAPVPSKTTPEVRIFGPFGTADAARDFVQFLGVTQPVTWDIAPMRQPRI
ncbi:hypothetical protein [Aeromicrobium chenweiae]|nr:hypothetical protein [Aeromicrobium chenweiae]